MVVRRGDDHSAQRHQLLELTDLPIPTIGNGEILIQVSVCAVCHTDLDVAEGRVVAPRYPVVPGHQVVGHVTEVGAGVSDRRIGDRVGVAWIHWACGVCEWCVQGLENLCPRFRSTGCDADGGYADYIAAPAAFTYLIPDALGDADAAPLLCAGAIGWRSLQLTGLRDGDPLGLTGFGASAHLVLQLARHRFKQSPVYVFARNEGERVFARELGADWVGDTTDEPPEALAAIIDTTPAWKPIVEALARLRPGGRLVVNAIRKLGGDQGELARLDYAKHLWMERELKSVANVTRADVREMLAAAADMRLRPTIQRIGLEQANDALDTLRHASGIRGATILQVAPPAAG